MVRANDGLGGRRYIALYLSPRRHVFLERGLIINVYLTHKRVAALLSLELLSSTAEATSVL